MSVDMQRAARGLASRGYHVFPVRPGTKYPLVKWGTAEPATTDPDVIGRWWSRWPRASVAVACGPSGLVVVDVDGPAGMASWAGLAGRHDHIATASVTTGRPDGGHHLWFLAGAGPAVTNSSGRLGDGLDVRGAGGMVIAPPSWHRSGVRYRWASEGLAPAPLPQWVRTLAQAPPPAPRPARLDSTPARPDRVLAALVQVVMDAAPGDRNGRLYWAARRVAEHASGGRLDAREAEEALLLAAEAVGLPYGEAERTVRSGLRHLGVSA